MLSVLPGLSGEAGGGPAGAGVATADDVSSDQPVLQIACNLTNRDESDLRAAEALINASSADDVAGGWLTRPIWFYLIGLAWMLAAMPVRSPFSARA